jgi:hypothetical protein
LPGSNSKKSVGTGQSHKVEEENIDSKNSVLLGIKYEAARIGDVGEDALAGIEEQIKREVGDGWKSDDRVLRGRNAVGGSTDYQGSANQATGLPRSQTQYARSGAGYLGGSPTVTISGPARARSSARWR